MPNGMPLTGSDATPLICMAPTHAADISLELLDIARKSVEFSTSIPGLDEDDAGRISKQFPAKSIIRPLAPLKLLSVILPTPSLTYWNPFM